MNINGEERCAICKYVESWEKTSTNSKLEIVREKGIQNIIRISLEMRKDGFHEKIAGKATLVVHSCCRLNYIRVDIDLSENKKRKLEDPIANIPEGREEINEFNFEKQCVVCFKNIHGYRDFSIISSDKMKQKVVNLISDDVTLNQQLRAIVMNKLLCDDNSDLPFKYHRKSCMIKVSTKKISMKETEQENNIKNSMEVIFNHIDDNEENIFHIQDLKEVLESQDMFIPADSTIWIKLKNHYQEDIIINTKCGTRSYCCLSRKGYEILSNSYSEDKKDEDVNYQLIDKVVQILLKEIKEHASDFKEYPASDIMFEKVRDIPLTLKYFLEKLFLNEYKKRKNLEYFETTTISIAHAIMFAAYPRLILSPLHISVGVTLHRKFGSKELIDMCNTLGFCCSYKEVRNYETSAAMQGEVCVRDGAFIQFVYDNADWNVETLDGQGTFHSMGGCKIITPASYVLPKKPIPRLTTVSEEEITAQSKIEIKNYQHAAMEGFKYFCLPTRCPGLDLQFSYASKINSYWMLQKYLKPTFEKGWNGFMEELTSSNTNYEISVIDFLPFIHASPSDYNTIFTTINQAVTEARRLNMKTCIVTFDQPLYFKARDIVGVSFYCGDILVVIRLGGFHKVLSLLGSIAFPMKDSGLTEVLLSMYKENTIKMILTGHQYP